MASAALVGPLAVSSPSPDDRSSLWPWGLLNIPQPFSHPANLIAYSAGGYEPRDFAIAGTVMAILIGLLTALTLH
ncbi:MAG: hypothetical protein L7G91_06200 [Acidilobus sp.]|nr:hypothetical protein [Acidilobus sp.]MCG2890309.1 hypothetical protein [Acidilobus sp.]MCG2891752.1 hypothetical protein [Acidilobus sp.]